MEVIEFLSDSYTHAHILNINDENAHTHVHTHNYQTNIEQLNNGISNAYGIPRARAR
jgi:hypothetical protein